MLFLAQSNPFQNFLSAKGNRLFNKRVLAGFESEQDIRMMSLLPRKDIDYVHVRR